MTTQELTAHPITKKRASSWRKRRVVLLRLAVLPVIALAVLTAPTWPEDSLMNVGVEMLGYFVLLAGLIVRIWATLYIGGRKSHELVAEGPYSVCRNPLYCGTFLIAVGAGLACSSLTLAAAMVVVLVPAHLAVTLEEERHLLALFPESYPQYMRDVPRYWPRWRQYRSREWLTVSSHAAWRMCNNTALVLLLPAIEDLIELLQHHHIIPVLLRLP